MALDATIALGAESAYGTPATEYRGYEGKADSWKTSREFLESVGFRAGLQTARADRRRIVDMGGEGELECDVLDAGMGELFAAAFDVHTTSTDAGSTVHNFHTASVANGRSFTAEMVRPKTDGGVVAFRHKGCVATGFELTQEVDSPLALTVSFDFRTVEHGGTPAVAEYPKESFPYDWTVGMVEVKSAAGPWTTLPVTKWELSAELGLKTDRRFVRANQLKDKPVRAEVPTYEGGFEAEFTGATLALYEAFTAGNLLSLRITYTGRTADTDGTRSALTITAPAIQFTGESPESSVDEVTTIALPFKVLDPGSADAITVTITEPA
ncbi:hypothetical protein JOD54_000833 [Actinokineospora baliensis]|uniref:phage tail tube protein n=1 Tax=Actinokineospora baliensis TaxID=547056 RepID=UPI001955FF06|nr:phage tail tube protein [Actinokineospora baliensis]MBM7770629.1 hypothetical protein [Actinokineospora baliensis]